MRTVVVASTIACTFAATLVVGCAHSGVFVGGRFEDAHVSYQVGAPGKSWVQVHQPKANVAWYSADFDAVLLANSSCEGVGDSSLESFTNDLLIGTTEREIISQNRDMLAGREILETLSVAKVDGVARQMKILVLKKDGCVYELVLAAPVANFLAAEQDGYAPVRAGFDVAARRDR